LFIEQPAPPPSVASVQPQGVAIVAQNLAPAVSPPAIASPEALPPQSVVVPLAPTPEPSPTPFRAEPTPQPSLSPVRREPLHASPIAQPSPEPSPNAALSSTAQRRQEIEQHLAEIVSKQRAEEKAQQQQAAETEAAKYVGAGEFEDAKQAAGKQTLPKDVRTAILKRINAQQAKAGKPGTIAKGTQKPGANATILNRLSIAQSANGAAPSYTLPSGVGATPGSYSTRSILPSAQPLLQFPARLIGKNLSLIYPLSIQAPITSAFGWRVHPITGTPRFHRGLDIGAPYGTPVIAAKAGRVETADFLDGYGLTIILRHNDTQQTLYAHLSEVLVKPGDWVKQGSLVGQVGSTGNSTGPHLHFEFLQMSSQGWVALDPAVVLNQALSIAQAQPTVKTGTGQTLSLSASGTLNIISSATAMSTAEEMIPGYSLIADWLDSPSLDEQNSILFPFAMLPPAMPEVGWLLSPFVDNFLAEQPNAIASFLGLSQSPPDVLAPIIRFQAVSPPLAKELSRLPKQIATLPFSKDVAIQAAPEYRISQSTILQTAIQPQTQPATAVVSTGRGKMAQIARLTAFQSNLNGNLKSNSVKQFSLQPTVSGISPQNLAQIRNQQLPKVSEEKLGNLERLLDRQIQVKQISDARAK
jgi:murein DD-endopeptidase MepM/ murein hydrolase activator NlpD